MTHVRFRGGAQLCAVAILISLAGCGEHRSVLAPTRLPLEATYAFQSGDVTPEADQGGSDGQRGRPADGPRLTLYNGDFRYTYREPSYSTAPQTWVRLDVVAGEPVTVNWFARTRRGAHLHAYRWALDIGDVFDETPRINEATDLAHWSQPSATTTTATVGPFAAGEEHLLNIEATDTNGIKSLATVDVHVVQ